MLAALFFCGVHLPRFALSIMRCQPALRLFSLRFVDTSFAPVRASLQILFSPINPFSMSSFASASPWANVETSNSCIVMGACLSSSTIVPPHLITLSALASTFGEIVRPICLAAFRLMTNSNFADCSMGESRAARANCLFFIAIFFLLHKFNFPLGELDMVIANSNERDIRQVNNAPGVLLTIFAFRE